MGRVKHDDFRITIPDAASVSLAESAIERLKDRRLEELLPEVDDETIKGLKFADILPREMSLKVLQGKLVDPSAVEQILNQPMPIVVIQ